MIGLQFLYAVKSKQHQHRERDGSRVPTYLNHVIGLGDYDDFANVFTSLHRPECACDIRNGICGDRGDIADGFGLQQLHDRDKHSLNNTTTRVTELDEVDCAESDSLPEWAHLQSFVGMDVSFSNLDKSAVLCNDVPGCIEQRPS